MRGVHAPGGTLIRQILNSRFEPLAQQIPIERHQPADDIGHVSEHVRVQIKNASVYQVRNELLAVIEHDRLHQRPFHLPNGTRLRRLVRVDQITEKLHHRQIRFLVVQRAREQSALKDRRQRRAFQERDRRSLKKPGAQPEEIVDRIRVVPQTVLLLDEREGRLDERLQHVDQTLHAVVVRGVLVDQDTTEVEETRMPMHPVQHDDLLDQRLQNMPGVLAQASQREPHAPATLLHYPQIALVFTERAGKHRPDFGDDVPARVALLGRFDVQVPEYRGEPIEPQHRIGLRAAYYNNVPFDELAQRLHLQQADLAERGDQVVVGHASDDRGDAFQYPDDCGVGDRERVDLVEQVDEYGDVFGHVFVAGGADALEGGGCGGGDAGPLEGVEEEVEDGFERGGVFFDPFAQLAEE